MWLINVDLNNSKGVSFTVAVSTWAYSWSSTQTLGKAMLSFSRITSISLLSFLSENLEWPILEILCESTLKYRKGALGYLRLLHIIK